MVIVALLYVACCTLALLDALPFQVYDFIVDTGGRPLTASIVGTVLFIVIFLLGAVTVMSLLGEFDEGS